MGSESLQSRNFYVEKHNLVLVCRFVIKSVIDKASIGDIEEDCPELVNFLATIEHILNHRARVSMFNTGYGNFWNFIREATAKMAENCISKVYAMNSLKSNVARGRCWLRLALMEKRLAAYLKHSIAQPELLKKYYTDGAIILSEEMQLLIADLIGLEAVDLNFCLRSKNMNLEGRILVDYSPYLQFVHCKEGLENDLQEIQESGLTSPNNSVHPTAASQFPHSPTFQHPKGSMSAIADRDVKERLAALQRSFRTTSEQKGYLEQMLKKSELEILVRQADHEKMLQNKDSQISKLEGDVQQLERIVLELQGDLTRAKSHNKEMQNLITLLYKRVNGTEANDRAAIARADSSSMYSDNLSMDDLNFKDDNSSLKPLAGSLASDTGSLTASYERGAHPAELSSLERSPSASSRNLSGDALGQFHRRMHASSELSQDTTADNVAKDKST